MCKALLVHNFQLYPPGLVLLLLSSKQERADMLNGFIVRIFLSALPPFYVTEVGQ